VPVGLVEHGEEELWTDRGELARVELEVGRGQAVGVELSGHADLGGERGGDQPLPGAGRDVAADAGDGPDEGEGVREDVGALKALQHSTAGACELHHA